MDSEEITVEDLEIEEQELINHVRTSGMIIL